MKNYNESILESMSNRVVTLDVRHRITKCNSAAMRILKTDAARTVGLYADDFFSDKNRWIAGAVKRVLATGQSDLFMDIEMFLHGVGSISVNMTIVPVKDVKGEFIGSMLVLEDITKEKRLKGTMSRYMPKEIAAKLLESDEVSLGGKIHEATVFFSDIRSFTFISEKIGAQQTVAMLNEYFTLMVDIIFQYSGILDKYIGDAILAVFGIPFRGPEDPDNSVRAAVGMLRALKLFNKARIEKGQDPIDIGIGINTAEILSGNIGSMKRMDYTVIGDGVNLASRLESANKYYGTKILISDFTFKKLKGRYLTRGIDYIRVKGKNRPVEVYEILDFHDNESFPRLSKFLELYREGLAFYRQMSWNDAKGRFEKALAINNADCPSRIYVERCQYFMQNTPGKNWDGIWVMKDKYAA